MDIKLDSHFRPCDTHHGLPVYPLYDVLSRIPLTSNCPLSGVSKKWRCVLIPKINPTPDTKTQYNEVDALYYLDKGIPCRLERARSADVYEKCGQDAFEFLFDKRWNNFPKPKIAFRAGWAGPGTTMESAQYHHLVKSFRDVVEHIEGQKQEEPRDGTDPMKEGTPREEESSHGISATPSPQEIDETEVKPDDILNLQLFHRSDPHNCPQVPVLAEGLAWPAFLDDGAICDNATRVSQRGAVTWWHLDDSGEFVEQTGLPLKPNSSQCFPVPLNDEFFTVGPEELLRRQQHEHDVHQQQHDPLHVEQPTGSDHAPRVPLRPREYYEEIDRTLYSTDEAPSAVPVKLFIYGPKQSYDWFMHDDEATVSGKIASIDLFRTPDEALPDDHTLLPILAVAVLESHGRPLISPPNTPHIVISVNTCVMVEQRRVAHLFLDEISYFLHKCTFWDGEPIVYEYVEKDLQATEYVAGQLIPLLMETFKLHSLHNPYEHLVRRRVVMALYSIAKNEKHFALDESSRRSLLSTVTADNEEMVALLNERWMEGPVRLSLREYLDSYWDVKQFWPKAGCVFRPPCSASPKLLSEKAAAAAKKGAQWYIPVVYLGSSPVYGTEKPAVGDTLAEYNIMARLSKRDAAKDATATSSAAAPQNRVVVSGVELFNFLRNAKAGGAAEKDELLDELF